MELRQESLFADETKGGIEVIYSKFSVWITSVLPARESVCSRFVSLLAGTM